MKTEQLIIFDTTLRDGEQSPGASMNATEKLRIAKALERMKVDVIEAGFAIASEGDFLAIQNIAKEIRESKICSLARAKADDITRAGEALRLATQSRIHTFIATSPIHMQHKLRMSPDQVVERTFESVKLARNFTDDVEFSCEDASRSELDFLCRVIRTAIDAGATTINLPDTVGYGVPLEFGKLIGDVIAQVGETDKVRYSVHCHNDLGLAVANSLAAVAQGARQVECTINGLGERAGNASLEEIVMTVRTRKDMYPVEIALDTTQIVPASRLVATVTGFPVQPNKAIVGANAFAHEAGIHQDGVIKHRETYEIMQAKDVGWSANRLVLGKHSGRAAFKARLEALGITLTDKHLDNAFVEFKKLADRKHEVFDEDLQALASSLGADAAAVSYRFKRLDCVSSSEKAPNATLTLEYQGKDYQAKATGSGPVDATFKAIEKIADSGSKLVLFSVNAITGGTDSQGEVTVRLERDGNIVNGSGAHTDIVVASAKAYLNALNIMSRGRVIKPQEGI